MSLDWHLQCSPPPVQTWSLWCHSAGRASLRPSVLLGSYRRKRLLQHLHPSCRTEGLQRQCPATWIKAMHRLLCMFTMGVFCMNVVQFVYETVSHPSPSRSTTATSYPKEDASPGPWKVCSTTSLKEASLSFFNRTTAPLWLALGAPATTVRPKLLRTLCPVSRENPGVWHHGLDKNTFTFTLLLPNYYLLVLFVIFSI